MKAFIVLANEKKEGSFCHALAEMAKKVLRDAGYEVILRDLYAERFDPVLTHEELSLSKDEVSGELRAEIEQILATDLFVVIHPNWWGMPPAILKGWIDRCIRQGFCYAFTADGPVRMLEGRKAIVFTTANTPPEIEVAMNHDPLDNLWKNIVFKTIGIDDCVHVNIASLIMSTPEQREQWLADAKFQLESLL